MLQKKAEDWDVDEMQENGEELDRRDGAARFLGQMLETKFGALDDSTRACLATADFARILAWTDRMLEAESLADVFGE